MGRNEAQRLGNPPCLVVVVPPGKSLRDGTGPLIVFLYRGRRLVRKHVRLKDPDDNHTG